MWGTPIERPKPDPIELTEEQKKFGTKLSEKAREDIHRLRGAKAPCLPDLIIR
jgi:hypothetical protein